jgi:hypothetical protein
MVNFKKLRQMIEVKGNGNILSKEFPVSSYIRLHLSAKGVIELVQSTEEKVIIETDENLQDYFEVQNAGRTLYITSEAKFRKPVFTHCKITVCLRQLDMLYVRCEGAEVSCPANIALSSPLEVKVQSIGNTMLNISTPSLKLLNQSQGDVTIKGNCGEVKIKNQSEGNLSCKELIAESLTIKNMAVGNVELYAEKEITIKHMGEGFVHYYGNAVLKDVKQHGNGQIKHME